MTQSWWLWIVLASLVAFGIKWLGYMVPARWLHQPRIARTAGAITIALLAALVAMNAFAAGQHLALDARLAALMAAALGLALRLPFLAVVVLGAVAAAAVRWWV